MMKRSCLFALVLGLLIVGVAGAGQYPLLDMVANKVVQKYQQSTCEQLWQEKAQQQGKPKPEMEQRLIQMLRGDAGMRAEFLRIVAPPVTGKMLECGMIP